MPTNVTAEYKAAETAYREARTADQRLAALREMLRTIPKHKGTEHLQAAIKSRIKELTAELSTPQKGAARGGPPTSIRPEGAAQVSLIGPPNSGKSALHARLTGSHAASEPYPFATQWPEPGMIPYEDIWIQLIDLPSISPSHEFPWIGNAINPADAGLLVVDLNQPDCVEATAEALEVLKSRKVQVVEHWPADPGPAPTHDDPFVKLLPAALVFAKADVLADAEAEVAAFFELVDLRLPFIVVSVVTGTGLDEIGRFCFDRLGIVRVYTRAPGRKSSRDPKPFTLRTGQTVMDLAVLVHKDLASSLSYARLWGGGDFEGQQVGRDHVLLDGDVIELHT